MKRIINLAYKILIAFLIIIGGIIFMFNTSLDDIEESVITTIQQNLETPLILDDVEFTIYETFPYASVKITNLLVMESSEFNNDTLLFTRCAYVKISLFEILNKIYDLRSIIITDGKINVKYNASNIPNFLIFKKNPKKSTSLSINKITLLNTKLNITQEAPKIDISWHLNRSIISINNQNYKLNTEGFSNRLIIGKRDYMNTEKFDFIATTKIAKDTIAISKLNLQLTDLLLIAHGNIYNGNTVDLEIEGGKQRINHIITHLPKDIQKICSPFIANGKINFQSSLKGLINKDNNPLFEMDYEITEGDFELRAMPFKLNDIQINGHLTNGENKNFKSTVVSANLFKAKTKNGFINGNFTLKNLTNHFLTSQFKSSWDLQKVNEYFNKSPFIGLQGRLHANTNYNGRIAFNGRFKKMFLNARHISDIKLQNVSFSYQKFPLKFTFKDIDCTAKNKEILVKSSNGTISETDFTFNGKIINLIAYITQGDPKIYIDGNIQSTYTNFSELLTLGNISKGSMKGERNQIMPNWINANTTIDIKKFSYENFIASNLIGNLSYKKGIVSARNLNASSLNGEIFGNFTLAEPITNHLRLISDVVLNKINIRNSFDAFNNYGQTFITQKQLKGVGSAKINIESHWKPNFILDKKKLKIKSHLIVEKGELIDFKPLESLSSYISLNELKHVKFSTFENTIDVSNEIITIPTMEIKSSALSVFLSGTHTFNQQINYDLTLLLSEILSTSFRRENTKITEFGEEKKDGKIFNTVYFKMTGHTHSPKISLNKIRFMEDVKKNIQKEKETIMNIIQEDILQKGEKKIIEKGQEIEIEWNPEL